MPPPTTTPPANRAVLAPPLAVLGGSGGGGGGGGVGVGGVGLWREQQQRALGETRLHVNRRDQRQHLRGQGGRTVEGGEGVVCGGAAAVDAREAGDGDGAALRVYAQQEEAARAVLSSAADDVTLRAEANGEREDDGAAEGVRVGVRAGVGGGGGGGRAEADWLNGRVPLGIGAGDGVGGDGEEGE